MIVWTAKTLMIPLITMTAHAKNYRVMNLMRILIVIVRAACINLLMNAHPSSS
jgi:hypothetical protein